MYYNTEPLLAALDSLIESAQGRLTFEELQLLATIRTGIAEAKSDQLIEDNFSSFIRFLLLIKEYIDRIL